MEQMSQSIISTYSSNKSLSKKSNNIITDYMNKKAKLSNYSNQYINDDYDTIINDFDIKKKMCSILDLLTDILNDYNNSKKITTKMSYDIGFALGLLSQILPNEYEKDINMVRDNFINENLNKLTDFINCLKENFD